MKQIILSTLFIAFIPIYLSSQGVCSAYLPGEGTTLTYANFDKKGKQTSTTTTQVTSVKVKGDTTFFTVHQLISTGKKKNDLESDFKYKCSGNTFYIDMNTVLNQEMMAAYDDASLKVTTNNLEMPANLKPGMELDDGEINMEVQIEYMTTNISARTFYREVEAKEEITTPAGTFSAYRIKGYVESKIAFMRFAFKVVEWYVEDIGVVRSETFDKKNNLMGYTELQKIENQD